MWPTVGFFGYWAGIDTIVIDPFALTDALLARLPSHGKWRIGHFKRRVPRGYRESLRSGENRLVDPGLREYYEHLRLVTQGPLWSPERLATIVRLNLGAHDALRSGDHLEDARHADP